jgi:hypothetical protein
LSRPANLGPIAAQHLYFGPTHSHYGPQWNTVLADVLALVSDRPWTVHLPLVAPFVRIILPGRLAKVTLSRALSERHD